MTQVRAEPCWLRAARKLAHRRLRGWHNRRAFRDGRPGKHREACDARKQVSRISRLMPQAPAIILSHLILNQYALTV